MATDMPHQDPTPAKPGSSEQTPPGTSSSTPANRATSLIRQLLSGYPSLKDIHDPEGYFSNLVTILMMYPEIDAAAGVAAVANHGGEFPPSRFTLRQACEKATQDRVRLEKLRAMPKSNPTRTLPRPADPPPGPDGKHPPGTILSDYVGAVRLYGRPRERE